MYYHNVCYFFSINRHMKICLLVFTFFLINGCNESSAINMYSPKELTTIEVESVNEDTVKIIFNTMLETLYYCPGLNVSKKQDRIYVSFIRCQIKENCSVTHKALKNDGGNYYIFLKNNGKPISILFENGEKKLYSH